MRRGDGRASAFVPSCRYTQFMTRGRESAAQAERVYCRYCGYDLAGISAERCPECGIENPTFRLESPLFRSVCFTLSITYIIVYLLLFIGSYEAWHRVSWYVGISKIGLQRQLAFCAFWLAYSIGLGVYAVFHQSQARPVHRSLKVQRGIVNIAPMVYFVFGIWGQPR